MTEWTRRAGAFLLGRKTYEMFAASWPKSTDPADESATALNIRPKFVASRTLDKVTWNISHLLKVDVAEEVAKLKAQDGGEIQVHGSGDLLQTLLKRDLVDALRLWQFLSALDTSHLQEARNCREDQPATDDSQAKVCQVRQVRQVRRVILKYHLGEDV
jgi:dihydrofolate reductase